MTVKDATHTFVAFITLIIGIIGIFTFGSFYPVALYAFIAVTIASFLVIHKYYKKWQQINKK